MFICVAPASIEFSIISFNAADGETTTSPAAKNKVILMRKSLPILLMVDSSNFLIEGT